MWQAVLFNHAKAGYLDMPEKGGAAELSDEAVEAAAEYMLSLTFPELPTD
jgi:cytochrome c5